MIWLLTWLSWYMIIEVHSGFLFSSCYLKQTWMVETYVSSIFFKQIALILGLQALEFSSRTKTVKLIKDLEQWQNYFFLRELRKQGICIKSSTYMNLIGFGVGEGEICNSQIFNYCYKKNLYLLREWYHFVVSQN